MLVNKRENGDEARIRYKFRCKINKNLLMPHVSVVVSGDFYRFKLALPSLLSLSKDEVKALRLLTWITVIVKQD